MPDTLVRAVLKERGVDVYAVDATGVAIEAEWRHLCGRVAATALARTIAGAALLGGPLRDDERLSVQLSLGGHLRGAMAEVDAAGNLRGFTHVKVMPVVDAGTSDWTYALGQQGLVTLIRSTGDRIVYSGTSEMARGDIAGDLERHLLQSEQRDAAIEIVHEYAGKVELAAGLALLALHGADREWLDRTRERFVGKEAYGLITMHREPEAVIRAFLAGEALEVVERRPIRFRCRCSREKATGLLLALGADDLRKLAAEEGGTTVTCHFCNDVYEFAGAEIEGLAVRAVLEPPPPPPPPGDSPDPPPRALPDGGGLTL